MVRDIKRFVNKKFLYTVDLGLLRRLLARHPRRKGLDLSELSVDDEATRARLFEYFAAADESYPSEMLDDLHRISELSTEVGARTLRQRGEMKGVEIIPSEELGNDDGMHLNPRYIALRTFLEHPVVFDEALDWLSFYESRSPGEFAGSEENVAASVTEDCMAAFRQRTAEFLRARYKGNYCQVRWYPDEDGTNLIVIHGKEPVSTLIIEDEREQPLTFREMTQDTVTYDPHTGRAKVSARTAEEREELCAIFAETVLSRPGFFEHDGATRLYTLDPIKQAGAGFQLNGEWDPELVHAAITEIQLRERKPRLGGWAATIRDSKNAIRRLFEMCPNIELQDVDISYVTIRFAFLVNGRKRRRTVRVIPPGSATFNRTSLESKIMEHLRRNGFCLPRHTVAAAA